MNADKADLERALDFLEAQEREKWDRSDSKATAFIRAHIEALTQDLRDARTIVVNILEQDYDAIETARGDLRYGITDCCDNDGRHYQSQALADALKAARVFVGDEPCLSRACGPEDE